MCINKIQSFVTKFSTILNSRDSFHNSIYRNYSTYFFDIIKAYNDAMLKNNINNLYCIKVAEKSLHKIKAESKDSLEKVYFFDTINKVLKTILLNKDDNICLIINKVTKEIEKSNLRYKGDKGIEFYKQDWFLDYFNTKFCNIIFLPHFWVSNK